MSRPLTQRYGTSAGGRRKASRRPPLKKRATRLNKRFSHALRWKKHQDQIATMTGAKSPSSQDFAKSVQDWQQAHGLPPTGVLGPKTWKKMKPMLDAAEPPEPPPPAVDNQPPPVAAAAPDTGAPAAPAPDASSSDDTAPPADDTAAPPDGTSADASQGELHYGFRARRRCQCLKCRAARRMGQACTCDTCLQAQQQQDEAAGLSDAGSMHGAHAPVHKKKSKAYVRWYQSALNRVNHAGLTVDGVKGPLTLAAVRAFQSQNGLVVDGKVGPKTEAALIRAGGGKPPVGSITPPPSPSPSPAPAPRGSNADVDTPLPASSPGLYSYHAQSRQYGTRQTVQALQSIGQRWAAAFPNGPAIGIGDISFKGGGKMSPHVSHQKGIDADIRLMRTDGAREGTTYKSPSYSRTLTQQLVDMIRSNDVLRVQFILNNDPQIHGVKEWHGHDDHLHVRFIPPGTGVTHENELGEEFRSHGMRCDCPSCVQAIREEELGELPASPLLGAPINRRSPAYVRWYQAALNKVLPATLMVDGKSGPKTRAAVAAFQRRSGLKVDGIVGRLTEGALLRAGAPPPPGAGPQPTPPGPLPVPPGPLPAPPAPNIPCGPSPTLSAAERDVLAVTSTLEGGKPFHCAVSATDGISMGSMQWNLKAGTLQSMLTAFERSTGRLATYFGADTDRLKRLIDLGQTPKADAVAQALAEGLAKRWHGPLSQVCADPAFCALQQRDIAGRLCTAWKNFTPLGLGTVRGLSMCYDIINGDGAGAMATVRLRALALGGWGSMLEAAKLERLANLAADRLSKLREERRARRLNLANIRTRYRGAPATSPGSYADQINRAVPGLDRAVTTSDQTVCAPTAGKHESSYEFLGEVSSGGSVNRKSNAYVRWVQTALNRFQGAGLVVDGKLGPKTRAAVAAFQSRALLKRDGIVGPNTEAALVNAGAPRPPGPATPAPRPAGKTFGPTQFHPGVEHNHQPTNRWAQIQNDSQSRLLHPDSAEGFASDSACAVGSPQMVADFIGDTLMRLLPLAKKHFQHYFDGNGSNLKVDLENVIRNDDGMRAKLAANIKARPVGHFRVAQSDYSSKDFQFAFGAIDRLDYEVDRAAGLVHVWFQDKYEWHPVGFGYTRKPGDERREDNCVHAALVELKNSGARDYWMVGDNVIPLSLVTGGSSGGGGGISDSL
jgi:peptidoglycan hydrolase-like protein with peptidoglycan-binding domain